MAGGVEDGIYTYDIPLADGGPRVPDVEDLGGTEIEDGDPPPHKGAQRSADMDNVQTPTLAGLCRMNPTCRLWIEFHGGNPTVIAVDSMGTLDPLTLGTAFSFTPNATGDLTISWDNGTLPSQSRKPHVWLTDDAGFAYASYAPNEIEVFTFDATAAAADLNFAVDIFG
jgi:hypothetical protein